MNKFLLILSFFLLALLFFLPGCSVHKVDVQQGNVITPEALEKIKVGMSQQQINSILGSPLIEDPFRNNRWDYVYRMIIGEQGMVQKSHVSLFFSGDKLDKIIIKHPPIAEKELLKPRLDRSK